MAGTTSTPGSWPGNTGILDLQVDVLEVKPEYALNAVQVEMATASAAGAILARAGSGDASGGGLHRLRGLTAP